MVAPQSNRIFMTVWNGGGNETYDMSAYTIPLDISLEPGGRSLMDPTQLAVVDVQTGRRAEGSVYNALLHQGDTRSLSSDEIVRFDFNVLLWMPLGLQGISDLRDM